MVKRSLGHYLVYLAFFTLLFILYRYHPYYRGFLRAEAQALLKDFYLCFGIYGLIYFFLVELREAPGLSIFYSLLCLLTFFVLLYVPSYQHLFVSPLQPFRKPWFILLGIHLLYLILLCPFLLPSSKPLERNKVVLLSLILWKIFFSFIQLLVKREEIGAEKGFLTHEEKVLLLAFLVKIFYFPLMLQFFSNHLQDIQAFFQQMSLGAGRVRYLQYGFWNFLFFPFLSFLVNGLFLIDTFVYGLGYTVELKPLHNEIKSVEPTLLGWAVALFCYPPFNTGVTGLFLPFETNYSTSWIVRYTWGWPVLYASRAIIFLGYLIFVWATVCLGPKASNLTNRGIVSRGVYGLVRHPAYTAKNIAWWFETLPYLSLGTWIGVVQTILALVFSNLLYILRALTEERHLLMDPDYQRYCRKVRFRFIPGLL